MGGPRAAADQLGSRLLSVQKAGECVGRTVEARADSRASSGRDGLGMEESGRLRGENVRRIRENTQRVRGVRGDEQSSWGGSDERGLGEGLGTFSPLLLFHPNPPTSSVFSPHPPNPLRILPDPADEIRAERGIMGRRVADRGVWERVESR